MRNPSEAVPVADDEQLAIVRKAAIDLIDFAKANGYVITIETKPHTPFAMGHYEMVPEVRASRGQQSAEAATQADTKPPARGLRVTGHCGPELEICATQEQLEKDAARYRWLRSRDVNAISEGGVFIGVTPENYVINKETADQYIDTALAILKRMADLQEQAKKGAAA